MYSPRVKNFPIEFQRICDIFEFTCIDSNRDIAFVLREKGKGIAYKLQPLTTVSRRSQSANDSALGTCLEKKFYCIANDWQTIRKRREKETYRH